MNRRTLLKGAGVSLLLPNLNADLKKTKALSPVRMVFISIGYGVTADSWFPEPVSSRSYKFTPGLKPLEKNRNEFSIIQNLTGNSGPHDASIRYLSCGQAETVDQAIAERIGKETRYQSLEITTKGSVNGHGKATSISKDKQGLFLPGEDATTLFYKLFASNKTDISKMRLNLAREKSLLDDLLSEIKTLNKRLGVEDKEILAQYYSSVRDLEKRISRAEEWLDVPLPKTKRKVPAEKLKASDELKTIYDLMAIAMSVDHSRVFSLMQRVQPVLDEVAEGIGAHSMSHYKQEATGVNKKASEKRDVFNSQMLSYYIDKLKETKDVDGKTLLDNSITTWGTPIRTGHGTKNGTIIVAGRGGGRVKQGQNLVYKADDTPLANLWYSLLKQTDSRVKGFADSQHYMSELFI